MRDDPPRLRHRIEYAGFRFAEAASGLIPLEGASALSGAVWRRFGPFSKRHRRAIENLGTAFPALARAEREAIAGDMWETLGRTFAETFRLREIAGTGRIEIENEEFWRRRARTDGGWIVCSAHFGNWELAAAGLAQLGLSTAGVYQKLSNPLVEAHVRKLRAFLYPAGLLLKHSRTGPKLLKAVRDGAVAAFLADQRDLRGVPVVFFGREAPTQPFPAIAARKLGAPLIAGVLERRPGVRFVMRLVEIEVPRTDDAKADALAATRAVQARIESWIREAPGQWMWAHRRWG